MDQVVKQFYIMQFIICEVNSFQWARINLSLCLTKEYDKKVLQHVLFPWCCIFLTELSNSPIFPSTLSRWSNKMMSFLCFGKDLAKSIRSLRTDQSFTLYSMFLLENSRCCNELLIERYKNRKFKIYML
jgi:hypothetical protein